MKLVPFYQLIKKPGGGIFLSLCLLMLLVGVLGALMLFEPKGPVAGTLAFAGLLALFRIFSAFENINIKT